MSERKRRISVLGAHTFAARIVVYTLGVVASVLIARAVGPSGRGRYYLCVTTATVAFYVANMGTEQSQFRLWARRAAPPEEFVTGGLLLSASLGVVAVGATWWIFELGRHSTFAGVHVLDMILVLAVLPVRVHTLLLTSLLIIRNKLVKTNVAVVAGAVVQTVGAVVLFATHHLTVDGVLALFVASIVVPWAVMLPDLRVIGAPQTQPPWHLMRELLTLGAQLEPYILFGYLNLRIDVFFVSRYRGLSGVGVYSIAVIFGELIWLATDSVAVSVAERQANAEPTEAIDVTMRAVRMSLVLAGLLVVAIGLGARLGIAVLYGPRFSGAASVVWVLLPASAAMAVWRPLNNALIRFDRPWVQPANASVALIANIVANLLLVPRLGILGAGLASTISYGCGAIGVVILFLRLPHASARDLVPRWNELRDIGRLLRPATLRGELFDVFRST